MNLELHSIHSFPPAAMNRDRHGDPKTSKYGGYLRARISSQAQKRPARLALLEAISDDRTLSYGIRSRLLPEMIVAEHRLPGDDKPAQVKAVEVVLKAAGLVSGEELAMLSRWECEQIGETLAGDPERVGKLLGAIILDEDDARPETRTGPSKTAAAQSQSAAKELAKIVHARLKENRVEAADIASFGRMLAGAKHLDVHSAVQVAHALSVHRVEREVDYFTAIDDLAGAEGLPTAGLLEEQGFNASTFYRYAAIDLRELAQNLTGLPHDRLDEAQRAQLGRLTGQLVRCLLLAVPAAGATRSAHITRPHSMLLTATNGPTCNLIGAFEQPVGYERDSEEAVTTRATRRLLDYHARLHAIYGDEPEGWLTSITPIADENLPARIQPAATLAELCEHASQIASQPLPVANVPGGAAVAG